MLSEKNALKPWQVKSGRIPSSTRLWSISMRKVGRAVRRAELVTAHRKKIDFAHTVRYLVDGLYPDTGRSGSYHGAGVFLLYAATWIMAEQGGDWVEGDHAELRHFSHCEGAAASGEVVSLCLEPSPTLQTAVSSLLCSCYGMI